MKMYSAIADSSCLIGLAKIKQFQLLKELFSDVYIPNAVYEEVSISGKGQPGSMETEKGLIDGWLKKKAVKDKLTVKALSSTLGKGESEVIVLYKELKIDYALIDEKRARDIAELMDVDIMGTIGIIELAIEMGFDIDKKILVDKLIETGFRISDYLYNKII